MKRFGIVVLFVLSFLVSCGSTIPPGQAGVDTCEKSGRYPVIDRGQVYCVSTPPCIR